MVYSEQFSEFIPNFFGYFTPNNSVNLFRTFLLFYSEQFSEFIPNFFVILLRTIQRIYSELFGYFILNFSTCAVDQRLAA